MSEQYVAEMRETYTSDAAKAEMRHDHDMIENFKPLQNLAMFYKLNQMHYQSAICFEEIYYIVRENYDDTIFLWSLLEAFVCFKKCSINEKAEWCLKEIESFFIGNKPYFEYITNNVIQ